MRNLASLIVATVTFEARSVQQEVSLTRFRLPRFSETSDDRGEPSVHWIRPRPETDDIHSCGLNTSRLQTGRKPALWSSNL